MEAEVAGARMAHSLMSLPTAACIVSQTGTNRADAVKQVVGIYQILTAVTIIFTVDQSSTEQRGPSRRVSLRTLILQLTSCANYNVFDTDHGDESITVLVRVCAPHPQRIGGNQIACSLGMCVNS